MGGMKNVFVLDAPFYLTTENPAGSLVELINDTSLTSLGNNYFMFDVIAPPPEPEPEPETSNFFNYNDYTWTLDYSSDLQN